jgi:hypothetical protein
MIAPSIGLDTASRLLAGLLCLSTFDVGIDLIRPCPPQAAAVTRAALTTFGLYLARASGRPDMAPEGPAT